MRSLVAIGPLLSAVLWPLPASADWEFAKWGMMRQELISASKGKAIPCGKSCSTHVAGCLNGGAYLPDGHRAFGFTFGVIFAFDHDGKLECVVLTGGDFGQIQSTFRKLYGRPAAEVRDRDIFWDDLAGKNTIRLMNFAPTKISYRPIGKGL